jgi:hypothetical protein
MHPDFGNVKMWIKVHIRIKEIRNFLFRQGELRIQYLQRMHLYIVVRITPFEYCYIYEN